VQVSYDANNLVKSSDHRPVFSQFKFNFECINEKEAKEAAKAWLGTPNQAISLKMREEKKFNKASSSTCCLM
jgi:hypothetical protein